MTQTDRPRATGHLPGGIPARVASVDQDHSDHVMVCLRPSEALRKRYADMDECTEPVEDLHITLYYLGTTEEAGGLMGQERLYRGLYDFAIHSGYRGLTGKINGFGTFDNPDSKVLIALWDIPEIAEFRTRLMDACRDHGFEPRKDNHGFTPHMTLAYSDQSFSEIPSFPEGGREGEDFGSVWMVWGDAWTEVTLS